ncbi:hypothetical protein NDU88_000476 [Pleurodeles waltl]|uniref:Uncharacterized protein n=1 Tax=Pleurodeles waltl TaxID=8319 RepID=A0AAV7KP13_PLEWA|nr:hypothetical protein NDU88_000476 [Pleurodeles waltl]
MKSSAPVPGKAASSPLASVPAAAAPVPLPLPGVAAGPALHSDRDADSSRAGETTGGWVSSRQRPPQPGPLSSGFGSAPRGQRLRFSFSRFSLGLP